MTTDQQQSGRSREVTRRDVLRSVARAGLLAVTVGGIAALTARSGRCDRAGVCSGCPALGGCALPEAVEYGKRRASAQRETRSK